MKIIKTFLPLSIFIILAIFLWRGLYLDPQRLPSALINKPVPQFSLSTLVNTQQSFSQNDLFGHVSLVNVWASWCNSCRDDQPILMDIAQNSHVPIYGFDYKDDRAKALQWLDSYGNPYQKIGFDVEGTVAIDWGVYGTPETFLIDQNGIIKYKQIGPMTVEIWRDKFLPLIQQLQAK